MNKEQELLLIIDNIYKAYDPNSPNYKFKFVFYNKTDTPFCKPLDFPEDLWYNSLSKDTTLMPVLLKGKEIDLRHKEQLNTLKKLNSSYDFIQNNIDQLKQKSERIRNKLQSSLVVYRKILNNFYNKFRIRKNNCNLMEEIDKININIKRQEYSIEEKNNDVILYLVELKDNLYALVEKIDEDLYDCERRMFVFKNINKMTY